jgi:hypothetical protein
VPTKYRRHAVTETPEVASALDQLRAATGGERPNLAELVVLGALVKAESVRAVDQEAAAALEDLAQMVQAGTLPVDAEAADEARRSWVRGS